MIKITSTGMYAWLVGTPKIKDNAMTPAPPAKPMPIPPILAPQIDEEQNHEEFDHDHIDTSLVFYLILIF